MLASQNHDSEPGLNIVSPEVLEELTLALVFELESVDLLSVGVLQLLCHPDLRTHTNKCSLLTMFHRMVYLQ